MKFKLCICRDMSLCIGFRKVIIGKLLWDRCPGPLNSALGIKSFRTGKNIHYKFSGKDIDYSGGLSCSISFASSFSSIMKSVGSQ
jgi:hypothetical protein